MNPPPIRILRRPTSQVSQSAEGNAPPPVRSKTFKQREADYAAARRRIMGSESEDSVKVSEDFTNDGITPSKGDNNEGPVKPNDQETNQTLNDVTPPSQSASAVSTKPSHQPAAIPLMSIPTAALSIPSHLERETHIYHPLSQPRQRQIPLLGVPTPSFSPHHHAETPMHGFANPPKFLNGYLSSPAVDILHQRPLPPPIPQQQSKTMPMTDQFLRQYQILAAWHLQPQNQLPQPIMYQNGACSQGQAVFNGLQYYQPSSRLTTSSKKSLSSLYTDAMHQPITFHLRSL
ncbi:unnamed protein product [Mesocestoides corti]|uniref:SUZ domain-containing protein n=2 Tax=Mesocestoides corti TaxID=53468 RepID=A0A0R3ULB5_MESCO|nr:unnamed protein product [Mesocestoides corti]